MLERLKNWIKSLKHPEFVELEEIVERVEDRGKLDAASLSLMRHILGSLDLSDVRMLKPMEGDELKQWNARLASNFDLTERLYKRLVAEQEDAIASGNEQLSTLFPGNEVKQIVFGRGTINGLALFYEALKEAAVAHHEASLPPDKPSDIRKMFPELDVPVRLNSSNTSPH